MIEISISIKDENSKLIERQIRYEQLNLYPDSPDIVDLVGKALANFNRSSEEAPEIIIRTKLVIQS